jgi:hypothetical protein
MAKKTKKTASPMAMPAISDMSSVLKSKGMGSRFKKPKYPKPKRKIVTVPKGVVKDRRNKSGGTDITKLLKTLAKSVRG